MSWLDIAFLLVFAVCYPVYGYLSFPREMRRIAVGRPGARAETYRQAMLWLWGLALVGVAVWVLGGRTLPELGFRPPAGAGFWVALALTVVAAALLTAQLRAVEREKEHRRAMRTQLGGTMVFLPRNPSDLSDFSLLSVTAGITEETLYRGWLIGVLVPVTGLPLAVLLSTVAFGLGHAYAGPTVAVRAGILGLVFALLYLLSGSLWVPILLHAFVDVNTGMTSVAAFRDVEEASGD